MRELADGWRRRERGVGWMRTCGAGWPMILVGGKKGGRVARMGHRGSSTSDSEHGGLLTLRCALVIGFGVDEIRSVTQE